MTLTDRVVPKSDVIFRALGAEAVVLNLDSGTYFGLNSVGTRIWLLLEQHDLASTCEQLEAEYDAPRERIQSDVLALVDSLEGKGLVERRTATTDA
jgi:hypothetical protein